MKGKKHLIKEIKNTMNTYLIENIVFKMNSLYKTSESFKIRK